ncbi:hypothetical protein AAZX31_12G226800 [Glycine max]
MKECTKVGSKIVADNTAPKETTSNQGDHDHLVGSANPSKDARGAYPSKDATLANLEGPTKIVAHREWMDVKRKPRRGNMNQKVATIGDLVNHNNKRKEGTKFSVFNQNYLIMLEGIKVVQNHSNRLLGVNEVTSSNVTSTSEKRELKKNENRCVQLDATTHGNERWCCSAVYASPQYSKPTLIWDHLTSIRSNILDPWLLVGDFNEFVMPTEMRGRKFIATRGNLMMSMIDACSLIDIEATGMKYTWYRKQVGNVTTKRLDRALVDQPWKLAFL